MLRIGFSCLIAIIVGLSGLYILGTDIFRAHLSDGWYSTNKQALVRSMDNLEKSAGQKYAATIDSTSIVAMIVPHAGYEYSGNVAAAAYKLLQPKLEKRDNNKIFVQQKKEIKVDQENYAQQKNHIRRVIILAPSHFASFAGIALPNFDQYAIPLGTLTVDKNIVQALSQHKLFQIKDRETVYAKEHSIEVQLPFIYRYVGNNYIGNNRANSVSIVPLIVGSLDSNQIREVADTLSRYIDEHTLVIVSSDFTHYGSRFNYTPFLDNQGPDFHVFDDQLLRIRQLDSGALQLIQNHDLEGFLSYVSRTGDTICGSTPIAILLALLEQKIGVNKTGNSKFGEIESHLIAYKTSQEVTQKSKQENSGQEVKQESGDREGNGSSSSDKRERKDSSQADFESVSYVSLVFTKKQKLDQGLGLSVQDRYTEYEKRDLLAYARATLEQIYKKTISPELLYPIMTDFNQKKGGVFVTLYTGGHQLRGCIGRITSQESIYKSVAAMTRASALEDSRFSPVTQKELSDITISISLLTEPRLIASYTDIELGKQGIILKNGNKSAVFLPKVATEFGWDLPTTLAELSQKAGLSRDAWQYKDTVFEIFESIDFSE